MAYPPLEVDFPTVAAAMREATSIEDFVSRIQAGTKLEGASDYFMRTLRVFPDAWGDLNEARKILGLAHSKCQPIGHRTLAPE
jgi:hypothetical protein